jgi:hypothetical protein
MSADSSGLWRQMDGDHGNQSVAQGAQSRAVPWVRIAGPDGTPHLRLAPAQPLPHSTETRAADSILARMLIDANRISEAEARASEATARELDLPLGHILTGRDRIDEEVLLGDLSTVHGAPVVSLRDMLPDPRLAHLIPRDLALRAEAVPVRAENGKVIVATARPDQFHLFAQTGSEDGALTMALASRSDILHAQTLTWGAALAREAETRAPVALSCRTWRTSRVAAWAGFFDLLLLWPRPCFRAGRAFRICRRGPRLHRQHHAQGGGVSRYADAPGVAAGRRAAPPGHRAAPAEAAGRERSRPDVRGIRDRPTAGDTSVAHALPAGTSRYPAPAGGG